MTPEYFPHRSPCHRPSRAVRPSRIVAMVTACAVALASVPARAQGAGGLPVIRDAEIEQLLRDYSSPILKAAGLGQRNIHVVIINDRSFNAFVIDAKRIFVNAGALMDSETPNQIIGVMAHETGHIPGGHLSKLRVRARQRPDRGDHRHAARGRRHGRRRDVEERRRGRQSRHRDDRRAGGDRALAARLSAPAGGAGRPRRRRVPQGDRPIAQGHVRHLQAVRRPDAVLGGPRRSLPAVAPDADRASRRALGDRQERIRTGTRRTRRSCRRATISCAPSCSASWSGPTPCCGATRRATPVSRHATPVRFRPTAMPTCASRSARWTR